MITPCLVATSILAAGGEVLGFVIFLIIAALSVLGQLQKKQEEQRQRRLREMIRQGTPPGAERTERPLPPLFEPLDVPRPVAQLPQPPQPLRPRPTVRPLPPPPRRPQPVRSRPASVQTRQTPVPVPTPFAAATRVAGHQVPAGKAVAVHGPASARAAALKVWLRPDTLRHQFILTEILRPPVALRNPEET